MMPFFIFNFRKIKLRLLIEGVPDIFLICLGTGPKKNIHAEDKIFFLKKKKEKKKEVVQTPIYSVS